MNELRQRHPRALPLLLSFAVTLSALDTYATSALLPIFARDFGSGLATASISAFAIAGAVAAPVAGAIVDRKGATTAMSWSLGAFAVASFCCGSAVTGMSLVVARALQGIAGGAIMVAAVSAATLALAPEARARFLGRVGILFALGSVAGPSVAALAEQIASWRLFFWGQVPLAIASLIAIRVALADTLPSTRSVPLSWAPIVALTAMVLSTATILHSIHVLADQGVAALGLVALAWIVAMVLYLRWERRQENGVIPRALFDSQLYRLTIGILATLALASAVATAYIPYFVHEVMLTGIGESGLAVAAVVIGTMTGAATSARVARVSSGEYGAAAVACVTATAALCWIAFGGSTGARLIFGIAVFCIGFAYGLAMPAMTARAQDAAKRSELGIATAFASLSRSAGAVVGIAGFGGLVASAANGGVALGTAEAGNFCRVANYIVPQTTCDLALGLRFGFLVTALITGTGIVLAICALRIVRKGRAAVPSR